MVVQLPFLLKLSLVAGFSALPLKSTHRQRPFFLANQADTLDASTTEAKSSPRTGPAQWLLDIVLGSPLWKLVLVPQARQKMVDTAAENGITWQAHKEWLASQDGPWRENISYDSKKIPDYYKKEFHAYIPDGNLCWDAALEAEIAAAAVGARNFPKYGRQGEAAFRDSFGVALDEAGAVCKDGATVVDLGCGTGMSTRWLAKKYPQAKSFLGIDMSEYFVQVGRRLLELQPDEDSWVSNIDPDSRIKYRQGNSASTSLADDSVDVVVLQFVAHELPHEVTIDIIREAARILKPSGQFWFCEMDFEAPAYAAQRSNALLFSLIRSTEPYLDEYADHALEIRKVLAENFSSVTMTAATGRHFSVVATNADNSGFSDMRFDDEGNYRVEDTHLKVFQNKM